MPLSVLPASFAARAVGLRALDPRKSNLRGAAAPARALLLSARVTLLSGRTASRRSLPRLTRQFQRNWTPALRLPAAVRIPPTTPPQPCGGRRAGSCARVKMYQREDREGGEGRTRGTGGMRRSRTRARREVVGASGDERYDITINVPQLPEGIVNL
ncbi:hypothetical protein FB451DRAFT_1408740 [Mycena latifolia]|nr:hypothetical protein FB451DRAFT_1408740 [Mycena latifolia]